MSISRAKGLMLPLATEVSIHVALTVRSVILTKDSTHVPKHVEDSSLIFVLINAVHLVSVINGVL